METQTELMLPEAAAVESGGQTPTALVALAVQNNLDIEKLDRLLALQRAWDQDQARKEFFAALSRFQRDVPPIVKTDAAQRKKFASLGTIYAAIREQLFANGLSFRFRQQQTDGQITVTCVVSHAAGHSEETTLTAAPDNSGNKNPIQSMGSTVTYLERYTLVAALGLTTVADDDDGNGGQSEEDKAREQKAAAVKAQLFGGAPLVVDGSVSPNTTYTTICTADAERPQPPQASAPFDPTDAPPPPLPESTPITQDQKERIRNLVAELDAAEALGKALTKRGVNSLNSLKFSDAADIINKLWSLSCQRKADAAAGASRLADDARAAENAGPCTAAQVELSKQLVAELEQLQPGISKKIKAKLVQAGLSKISDMTLGDCERFLQQLASRNLEAFFSASLAKPAAKN